MLPVPASPAFISTSSRNAVTRHPDSFSDLNAALCAGERARHGPAPATDHLHNRIQRDQHTGAPRGPRRDQRALCQGAMDRAAQRHASFPTTSRAGSGQRCTQAADGILQHREAGTALMSQAVLFRCSSHSAALELELTRRDIPFVRFDGLEFLEIPHMKGMLAVLHFAQIPRGSLLKPPAAKRDFRFMTKTTWFYRPSIRPRARDGRPFSCCAVGGCIPSDLGTSSSVEIDEERRPFYVALTRAHDHLHAMVLHRFYIYITQQESMKDRHVYAARTRFIAEGLLPQFESIT